MFDEYFQASTNVDHVVPEAIAPVPAVSTGSPSSISIDQDAPFRSITHTTQVTQSLVIPQGVDDDYHDCEVAHRNNDPLSICSIYSLIVVPPNVHFGNQPEGHYGKCRLTCQNG